jgi:hypothetical protein
MQTQTTYEHGEVILTLNNFPKQSEGLKSLVAYILILTYVNNIERIVGKFTYGGT